LSESLAGLYLHVPFCRRICPYCDFAVRPGDVPRRAAYVEALLLEIERSRDTFERIDTIYFGGGTPSMLEPPALARILDAARAAFDVHPDTRIFLEANPEDVDASAVSAWRDLGVNTLSLGVQSLDDAGLEFLGRAHDRSQAEKAVGFAHDAGFETVSIDLIYGRPGQTLEAWGEEMRRALALDPDHVSCYQLTIEPRTRFGALAVRGRLTPLDVNEQGAFFRLTHGTFREAGFEGYEVSQFASSPEHRSRHNVKYWNHTAYLGLGPSAHSYRGTERWWNLRKEGPWRERLNADDSPVEGRERLDPESLALEAMMVGFRTADGVDPGGILDRFGIDVEASNRDTLETMCSLRLLTVEDGRWKPTLDGFAVADALAARFTIEPPDRN